MRYTNFTYLARQHGTTSIAQAIKKKTQTLPTIKEEGLEGLKLPFFRKKQEPGKYYLLHIFLEPDAYVDVK